jgi:hypothetical protein
MERHAHQAAYEQGHGEEVRLARQESGLLGEPAKLSKEDDSSVDEAGSDKAGAQ